MYSPRGIAFVVLPSTAVGGTISRIRATLSPGSVVTTLKNTVDRVTEHGVADMQGAVDLPGRPPPSSPSPTPDSETTSNERRERSHYL